MTGNSELKIGGMLLAAGGSSRLGQPKQLLQFQGKTLLRRAAETLAGSACEPIVVVLGAETEQSRAEIADLHVQVVINNDWKSGMSSSIKTGLAVLLIEGPALDALVITLCDQPNVISGDIDALCKAFRMYQTPIVAADYGDFAGVPALFSFELFNDLLELAGDKGARDLIRVRSKNVTRIKLELAAIDIDTPDDLKRLGI